MSNASASAHQAFAARPVRGAGSARTTSLAIAALLVLFGAMSLVGVVHPALYRRETASYAAQAIGQDWVDLLVAVPWLAVTARAARRGSRRGRLLLGGGLAYAAYEFAIYAFAVHFNALFLVYCAGLGLSVFALVSTLVELARDDVRAWFVPAARVRGPAGCLLGVGSAFTVLWLSEVVPSLSRGVVPASVLAAGLLTSPVHVLDLSLLLPAHVVVGVLLWDKRPGGYLFAPVLLAFGALMTTSVASVVLAMLLYRVASSLAVAGVMLAVGVVYTGFLTRLLRDLRS
jgi:hypothetical protein